MQKSEDQTSTDPEVMRISLAPDPTSRRQGSSPVFVTDIVTSIPCPTPVVLLAGRAATATADEEQLAGEGLAALLAASGRAAPETEALGTGTGVGDTVRPTLGEALGSDAGWSPEPKAASSNHHANHTTTSSATSTAARRRQYVLGCSGPTGFHNELTGQR